MIDLLDVFYLLLHPRPAYIVGVGRIDEVVNFMAASWVTPVSEEPPRLAVAIDVESFTNELIKKYGDFTVQVYPMDRLDDIYFVGSRSGRNLNKAEVLGLRVIKGEKVEAPVLEDAIGVLECRLAWQYESGDTTLFIGDIASARASENHFDRSRGWNFRVTNIPLHNWGRGFYSVGRFRLARAK